MLKSPCGQYHRRSAYQFAYLGIFGLTISHMATSVLTTENPIKSQMIKLQNLISAEVANVPIIKFLMFLPQLFVVFFVLAFCVHLARIYITLEFMDDGEWVYNDYFDSYGTKGRFLDFLIRAGIIAIVSLKVIEVDGFKALPVFILAFYGALSLWTLNAMVIGKKGFRQSFGISSVAGLLMAFCLFMLANAQDRNAWQWLVALMALFGAVLAGDLIYFLFKHSRAIFGIYREKALTAW